MTVYIDLIILSNFLLDYSLITYTGIITKDQYKIGRIILATIFACLGLGLIYIRVLWLFFILRIMWSILIILIAFHYTTIKQFVLKIITFYFLNYLVAGIILSYNFRFLDKSIWIDLNNTTTWYILLFSFILANILTYIYRVMNENLATIKSGIIDIKFTFLNKDYYVKGLIDTGNIVSLQDTPVVFIDRSTFDFTINETYLMNHQVRYTYVQYKTIMQNYISLAFKPEHFGITVKEKYHEKDVYIALADNIKNKDQTFNVILNASILVKN